MTDAAGPPPGGPHPTATVSIDARFNGPPGSANGGYACGVAAGFLDGAARVTLRRPPPLNTPLEVHREADGVALRVGDELVIEAVPVSAESSGPPLTVGFAAAEDASRRYAGFERHPFPTCFTCGPRRTGDDGLRIYPGRVSDTDVFASPFVPDESVVDGSGHVAREVVWAALDCPSGIAVMGTMEVVSVLGRLTARLDATLEAGRRYIALGWPLGRDGRKLEAASAIIDEAGTVLASAEATWVVLRDQPAT